MNFYQTTFTGLLGLRDNKGRFLSKERERNRLGPQRGCVVFHKNDDEQTKTAKIAEALTRYNFVVLSFGGRHMELYAGRW